MSTKASNEYSTKRLGNKGNKFLHSCQMAQGIDKQIIVKAFYVRYYLNF